jgi:hypothetical protein
MTTEEINKGISEIDSEIRTLQSKRKVLEKKLQDSAKDFPSAFKAWYENSDECHYDWWIDESKFPLLNKISHDGASNQNYRRGETVTLDRMIEEEMWYVLDNKKVPTESDIKDFEKYFQYTYNKKTKLFENYDEWYNHCEALCKEAMDGNMKSFKLDW